MATRCTLEGAEEPGGARCWIDFGTQNGTTVTNSHRCGRSSPSSVITAAAAGPRRGRDIHDHTHLRAGQQLALLLAPRERTQLVTRRQGFGLGQDEHRLRLRARRETLTEDGGCLFDLDGKRPREHRRERQRKTRNPRHANRGELSVRQELDQTGSDHAV